MVMTRSHGRTRSRGRIGLVKRAVKGLALCAMSGTVGLVLGCAESISIDGIPPGSIADLSAMVNEGEVRLTWTEPGDPDVIGVLVARFPKSGASGEPEAGRVYAPGDPIGTGVAVFHGNATETIDTPPCSEQIYAGWAQDDVGNFSFNAETVLVSGVTGTTPPPPTGLAASISGSQITLSWTPPTDPRLASVRIVRKQAGPPANPSDGVTVFTGAAATAVDAAAELSPTVTWHYAAFACNPCAECGPTAARVQVTPTLVQSLKAGGFVVYWRHGTATTCVDRQDLGFASNATVPEWWKSCDRGCPPAGPTTALARQLDPVGVQQAQEIGAAIRAKAIPFSRVISSEYCRCRETAQHMNLGPMIETAREVTFFVYPEMEPCATIEARLATAPAAGTNTAVVAHVHPQCLVDGDLDLTLDNGQAAVYRPDGMGGATLIAKVRYNEWAMLP
jgi:hypothetical protein